MFKVLGCLPVTKTKPEKEQPEIEGGVHYDNSATSTLTNHVHNASCCRLLPNVMPLLFACRAVVTLTSVVSHLIILKGF